MAEIGSYDEAKSFINKAMTSDLEKLTKDLKPVEEKEVKFLGLKVKLKAPQEAIRVLNKIIDMFSTKTFSLSSNKQIAAKLEKELSALEKKLDQVHGMAFGSDSVKGLTKFDRVLIDRNINTIVHHRLELMKDLIQELNKQPKIPGPMKLRGPHLQPELEKKYKTLLDRTQKKIEFDQGALNKHTETLEKARKEDTAFIRTAQQKSVLISVLKNPNVKKKFNQKAAVRKKAEAELKKAEAAKVVERTKPEIAKSQRKQISDFRTADTGITPRFPKEGIKESELQDVKLNKASERQNKDIRSAADELGSLIDRAYSSVGDDGRDFQDLLGAWRGANSADNKAFVGIGDWAHNDDLTMEDFKELKEKLGEAERLINHGFVTQAKGEVPVDVKQQISKIQNFIKRIERDLERAEAAVAQEKRGRIERNP